MLFSSREVAGFIDATFEPAWESVRPAPLVTIDFGNGHTVTRTLQGNVATYVCDADGFVYDVLPGVYTPGPYRDQLALLAALAKPLAGRNESERSEVLKRYHAGRAAALAGPVSPQAAAVARIGGGIKGGIGGFGGIGGIGGGFGGAPAGVNGGGIEGPLERVLAGHPGLAFDAQVNETVRRRIVHEYLATVGRVRPDDLKGWLFKQVLNADLDDPLLGLGPVLNANYPFAEEDRKTSGR